MDTTPAVESEAPAEVSTTQDQNIQPVQAETETAQQTGEQGQSEDSFFDPKQVPEELMPAYKSMQAAFTKKTQEIADVRKNSEQWKEQAEKYAKYEPLIPVVEEMLSSKSVAAQNPEILQLKQSLKEQGYNDDAIELIVAGSQFTLDQFNKRQQAQVQEQQFNTAVDQAESLDPRLNDEKSVYQGEDGQTYSFGQIVSEFVLATPNWQADPVKATKAAIAKVDALIGTAKKQGKEELSGAARQKATKFPQDSSSPHSAASNAQPMSVREAAAQAKAELGIN